MANLMPATLIRSRFLFTPQKWFATGKLLFELRAGGYGGSTYTLNYDAASDSLRGVYDQVVVKQKFDVVFNRTK